MHILLTNDTSFYPLCIRNVCTYKWLHSLLRLDIVHWLLQLIGTRLKYCARIIGRMTFPCSSPCIVEPFYSSLSILMYAFCKRRHNVYFSLSHSIIKKILACFGFTPFISLKDRLCLINILLLDSNNSHFCIRGGQTQANKLNRCIVSSVNSTFQMFVYEIKVFKYRGL